MPRRKNAKGQAAGAQRTAKPLTVMHPNAAGIDVGSESHFVAVPEDRAEESVRRFGCFTADLHRLAKWLKECGVDTVAMESTGVYWIPLFQILESHGLDVRLVNARHAKNVPGRTKSDVADCRWLQRLHSYGLLAGSFRPADNICVLRSHLRHRETLVQSASTHVLRMQKALTQMNVQLHKVISDITGVSGLRIIDAILAGERNPGTLAALRDGRIRRSEVDIVAALEGDYRDEHLFALRHELELYRVYQTKIAESDAAIEKVLATFESKVDIDEKPREASKNRRHADLCQELYRVAGVDFTQIGGLHALTVLAIISEVGLDMSRWKTAKHFASWLRLCPNNEQSGATIRRRRTRPGPNRAANAFRMAAQSVARSHTALGAFYRRKRGTSGGPKAITATAHKIARLYYMLATKGHDYVDPGIDQYERAYKERVIRSLLRRARDLGYDLVETAATG